MQFSPAGLEEFGMRCVQLYSGLKPNRVKEKMKKSIFLAVAVFAGVGVATSKAGGAFGINLENSRGSASTTYVSGQYTGQRSYGYNHQNPYYSNGNGYGGRLIDNRYDAHEALHGQLDAERQVLEDQVGAQHDAWHQEWERQHKALHLDLDRQRAMGVPKSQVQAQHEAWHQQSRAQHFAAHQALRQGHLDARWDIRQNHEAGHEQLGW